MAKSRPCPQAADGTPSEPPTTPNPNTSTTPPASPTSSSPAPLPAPALDSAALRYSYAIGRGETGVLSFEPYKSLLLPHWAFRTPPVARRSSAALWAAFRSYVRRGDFVGADMARKFVQMGMTRARRYANHKGGRKYAPPTKGTGTATTGAGGGGRREELARWTGGGEEEVRKRREKEEASEIFKAVWRRCVEDEGYQGLKEVWKREKAAYVKATTG